MEIEFANDGVSDSLTGAMAPALFHQALRREIASADREARELVIASLRIRPDANASMAELAQELIALAFLVKSHLRGSDFFSRISDTGFWLLLRTDQTGAACVIDRLNLSHRNEVETALISRSANTYEEWIARIDQIHFGAH
jgi:GGDEF domain-containing protein